MEPETHPESEPESDKKAFDRDEQDAAAPDQEALPSEEQLNSPNKTPETMESDMENPLENRESYGQETSKTRMDSWKSASSVIGQSLVVKGEVEAAEDMLIEGRVEGSIRHTADRLIVGPSGTVNADVDARNLIVEGVLEGNIVGSESVVICETAVVRGNIYTARITIADGAQFSGTVDMDMATKTKH